MSAAIVEAIRAVVLRPGLSWCASCGAPLRFGFFSVIFCCDVHPGVLACLDCAAAASMDGVMEGI